MHIMKGIYCCAMQKTNYRKAALDHYKVIKTTRFYVLLE